MQKEFSPSDIELFTTEDGSHSLYVPQFGISYHSKFGAIEETNHVFINAGLRTVALKKQSIRILDIGFGTGLNALMTYLESVKRNLQILYTAVDAFPLALDLAEQLNYTEQIGALDLQADFLQMHASGEGEVVELGLQFSFSKRIEKFENLDFIREFDLIYFDAFAPKAQPELWEQPLMENMYSALDIGGILVTYCAQGAFKRNLKAAGFLVEALPGPPGKREMTRAIKHNN